MHPPILDPARVRGLFCLAIAARASVTRVATLSRPLQSDSHPVSAPCTRRSKPPSATRRSSACSACRARRRNVILGKLEGNNPAGSVKDRPALSMIVEAEKRGDIKPGDTLIEATSGNTGIALAMVAAMKGYRMILVMPEQPVARAPADDARVRRRARADAQGRRHGDARATSPSRCAPRARASSSTSSPIPTIRSRTTAAPVRRSGATPTGRITHFVSAMGTTGTIMGVSRFLKEKNPAIAIIGAQPDGGLADPRHPQVARGVPAEDLRSRSASTASSRCRRPTPRR